MNGDLTNRPTIVTSVPQDFFIEPLNSPQSSAYHLDHFPDSLYNKAPNSVLVQFLYALLGMTGVGYVQNGYVKARLALEDSGLNGFDLDRFYGDPMKFPRVLDETYEDAGAIRTIPGWDEIEAQDSKYRARAMNFVKGAHMGPTVNGLTLVAKSGLDKEVLLHEKYRVLFDQHSDLPLGLEDFGSTRSTNELVVTPLLTEEEFSVDTDLNQFEYEKRTMDSAMSRIKPADVLVSFDDSESGGRINTWSKAYASSEFAAAAHFVTGNSSIEWPDGDLNWIRRGQEVQAPETRDVHGYQFFHRIQKITASSTQVGRFGQEQQSIFPFLLSYFDGYSNDTANSEVFEANRALASVDSLTRGTDIVFAKNSLLPNTMFNHIYPDTYINFIETNVPSRQFWSSRAGSAGHEEYLMIDLGEVKAVNFVSFELLNKPIGIDIEFDVIDDALPHKIVEFNGSSGDNFLTGPSTSGISVGMGVVGNGVPIGTTVTSKTSSRVNLSNALTASSTLSSFTFGNFYFIDATAVGPIKRLKLDPQRGSVWEHAYFQLSDETNHTIFTRFIRLKLSRLFSTLKDPWNIDVRGLRVGRIS